MATSSILGADEAEPVPAGKDIDALGPSDSSDSGSDIQGERPMATAPDDPDQWGAVPAEAGTDTDATGTGERASASGDDPLDAADIRPDHIETIPQSQQDADPDAAAGGDDETGSARARDIPLP